jgi:hypothetical protein
MIFRRIFAAIGEVLELDGIKLTGATPGQVPVCNADGIMVPGAGGGGGFAAGGDLSGDGVTQHVESITHAGATPIPITINGNVRARVYPSGMVALGTNAPGLADIGFASVVLDDGGAVAWYGGGSPVVGLLYDGTTISVGDVKPLKLKGTQIEYQGGSKTPATAQGANFTALTTVRDYEITATGKTVTLDSGDPIGTEYQFHNRGTGFAASATTLTPNGGKTINGNASYTFDRDYGSQYVRKTLDGNWIAGQ